MASKQMRFDVDARTEISTGLSQLAKAVKATLGPRGRNVVLQKSFGAPRITKDGVTVAKEIELDDKGNRIPVDVKVGDTVLYSKYGGTEVKYGGEEYLVLSARDVLAIIEK